MNNNLSGKLIEPQSTLQNKVGKHYYQGVDYHFKRITSLKGNGDHMTFIQAFVRAYVDYLKANKLSLLTIEGRLRDMGKINVFKNKIGKMAAGKINPYTYVYSLQVLAEAVGLNMWDFVSVHQPEEKEAVRAVIKNPDLM